MRSDRLAQLVVSQLIVDNLIYKFRNNFLLCLYNWSIGCTAYSTHTLVSDCIGLQRMEREFTHNMFVSYLIQQKLVFN